MKKSVIVFAALVAMGGLVSAQGMKFEAIGPLMSYSATFYSRATDDASETALTFGAVAILSMADGLELDPELSFTSHNEEDPTALFFSIEEDLSMFSFNLGAGLYKSMLNAGALSLKTGPKAMFHLYGEPSGASAYTYSDYFNGAIEISLPLILDFDLGDRFALRISQPFATLRWQNESTTVAAIESSNTSLSFNTFYTGLEPTFFCFIKF